MNQPADEVIPKQQNKGQLTRYGHMAMAFALGAGLAGFYLAVSTEPEAEPRIRIIQNANAESQVPTAPAYDQMRRKRVGVNATWSSTVPGQNQDDTDATHDVHDGTTSTAPTTSATLIAPTVFYGDVPATAEQRMTVIAKRQERRAYAGAPPVVPHAIDQVNPQSCVACHGKGMKVGNVVAPAMSHAMYTNCTQCHVEQAGAPPITLELPQFILSEFTGRSEPGDGDRAWPGAPPVMPHTTWMRENCMSCHGTLASDGLRTSHPWRTNCTQCHAPSAELNQVEFIASQNVWDLMQSWTTPHTPTTPTVPPQKNTSP